MLTPFFSKRTKQKSFPVCSYHPGFLTFSFSFHQPKPFMGPEAIHSTVVIILCIYRIIYEIYCIYFISPIRSSAMRLQIHSCECYVLSMLFLLPSLTASLTSGQAEDDVGYSTTHLKSPRLDQCSINQQPCFSNTETKEKSIKRMYKTGPS